MTISLQRQHYFNPVTALVEKSIAVLPFENLSAEKDNAYFADGVQNEILTNLGRIADLTVISRSSVMDYKSGVARNLPESVGNWASHASSKVRCRRSPVRCEQARSSSIRKLPNSFGRKVTIAT